MNIIENLEDVPMLKDARYLKLTIDDKVQLALGTMTIGQLTENDDL